MYDFAAVRPSGMARAELPHDDNAHVQSGYHYDSTADEEMHGFYKTYIKQPSLGIRVSCNNILYYLYYMI